MVTHVVLKMTDANGQEAEHLVRKEDGKPDEDLGSIPEFYRLFDACVERWPVHGWDLNKLIQCVRECDFD